MLNREEHEKKFYNPGARAFNVYLFEIRMTEDGKGLMWKDNFVFYKSKR